MDDPQHRSATPEALPEAPPWGVFYAVLVLGAYVFIQMVTAALLHSDPDDLASQLTLAGVADGAAFCLVLLLIRLWSGGSVPTLRALGFRLPSWRGLLRAWWIIPAGAVGYFLASFLLMFGLELSGIDPQNMPRQPLLEMIRTAQPGRLVVAAGLVAVVIVPLAEEVLVRSVLYQAMRRAVGVLPAALIVSALFALFHFYPWGIAHLVIVSLVLVALFERTGSLWVPVVVHGTYNALMILLVRFMPPAS